MNYLKRFKSMFNKPSVVAPAPEKKPDIDVLVKDIIDNSKSYLENLDEVTEIFIDYMDSSDFHFSKVIYPSRYLLTGKCDFTSDNNSGNCYLIDFGGSEYGVQRIYNKIIDNHYITLENHPSEFIRIIIKMTDKDSCIKFFKDIKSKLFPIFEHYEFGLIDYRTLLSGSYSIGTTDDNWVSKVNGNYMMICLYKD